MFNSYSYRGGDTNIKINAVSGTIVKNYKDSFFKRFHLESDMAKRVFDTEKPHLIRYEDSFGREKPIVVLQSMVCGDMQVICEIMWKEDFDALFEDGKEQP